VGCNEFELGRAPGVDAGGGKVEETTRSGGNVTIELLGGIVTLQEP
jgi:hypothetical protein